jgi:hypothetical protein
MLQHLQTLHRLYHLRQDINTTYSCTILCSHHLQLTSLLVTPLSSTE